MISQTAPTKRNAIVLLSGGLDSTTVLAIAKAEGFRVHALTFSYGQRHEGEIAAARAIAECFGVERHIVAQIDLRTFGGSALTSDIPVPKERSRENIGEGIPVTYVPARNTIFLSFALAWAETLPATDIFIGVNALDYSGYPDCRPEFIDAFQKMANLATRIGTEGEANIKIHTPLLHLSKAQIIARGIELGIDYGMTLSCYDPAPAGESCGICDACLLRLKGFSDNNISDPLVYAVKKQDADCSDKTW
ncbi:MAG: 7-cyano-7-deazaguanine synthase QueC [Candidatus Riflebacteria bacterium]|nr:7-cyano-7-deazaguanine synthase QueC [Candidatus Riflebacteria bacterium]